MQACDRCHARKTRCDRRIPRCGGCEKAGAPCLHVDKLRSRNLPRGYVESVESDLRKAEQQNSDLQRQVSLLRSQLARQPATTDTGSNSNSPTPSGPRTQHEPASSMGQADNDGWRSSTGGAVPPHEHQHQPQTQTPGEAAMADAAPPSTTSSRTPADDAVATEVGYLTLTATGETRYLGSSSGMGLATIISSVVDPQPDSSIWPKGDSRDFNGRSPPPASSTPVEAPFPPRNVAMQYIEAYFQHTHITFPLLHRPSFLAAVEQIYSNPNYYAVHTFDAFAFDMVLSIGSSNFNRFEESMAGTAAHYARARTKLSAILNMGGLIPLQAITLLSQHGIFSNLRDTSASIWHLIGIGARICFELGLHLEPKRTSLAAGRPYGSNLALATTFEAEMRKRTFWCFYNLDRVVSFTLGRPVALRDEDIDISLPSPLEDEEFGPDRPIAAAAAASSESEGPKVTPFLHLIRIRRLSGKILSTLYAAQERSDVTVEEKTRVRRQLYEEVIAWQDATSLLKLEGRVQESARAGAGTGTGTGTGAGFVSCFLSAEWYDAVANNALLLLYRPSPYLPYPVTATKNHSDGRAEPGDLQHMFYAAKSSITSYYELHRKRRLNYSWITLHGVFIAGLAYVYGIGLALKDPTQNMPIPDYLDIINDTRACSNILVAICERWSVARSSCELFNRLSNAVIRDAINAVTKKDNPALAPWHAVGARDHPAFVKNPNVSSTDNLGSGGGGTAGHVDNAVPASMNAQQPGLDAAFGASSSSTSIGADPGDTCHNQFDHMFVADEFRQYTHGLDYPFLGSQPLPSELINGFSQDWPFDDAPFSPHGGYGVSMSGVDGLW